MTLEITGIIIVLLAGAMFGGAYLGERKKLRRKWEAVIGMGFTFSRKVPPDFVRKLGAFQLLNGSGIAPIRDVLFRSEEDRNIAVFTLNYYREGTRSVIEPGDLNVFFADVEGLDLPYFRLVLKTLQKRVQNVSDIEFSDYPDFSEYFLLSGAPGAPERKIRTLFTPRLIDFIESHGIREMEGWQTRLILISHVDIIELIERGEELIEIIRSAAG